MSERITDKDLGALDSLEELFDEHGVHMPGASAMLPRLIAEVRALREENERLKKRTTVKFDEVYMGPEA